MAMAIKAHGGTGKEKKYKWTLATELVNPMQQTAIPVVGFPQCLLCSCGAVLLGFIGSAAQAWIVLLPLHTSHASTPLCSKFLVRELFSFFIQSTAPQAVS